MLSIEACRKLLGREDLTDEEVADFLRELRNFIGQVLDDYLRDNSKPDEV